MFSWHYFKTKVRRDAKVLFENGREYVYWQTIYRSDPDFYKDINNYPTKDEWVDRSKMISEALDELPGLCRHHIIPRENCEEVCLYFKS